MMVDTRETLLADVFEHHTYHTFKAYKPSDTRVCKVCTQTVQHPIHDVSTATESRRKCHDFMGVHTMRADVKLCLFCDNPESYSMHNNGSALVRSIGPSQTLPDEPPTYGPHTYVSPIEGDTTLPCQACRYSSDAEHHVRLETIRTEAVLDHIERERRDKQSGPQLGIAEEAQRIVYGDREQAYDDPNINFNKLAHMWTGHLLKKLKPDVHITSQDVALMMVMLKLSREGFRPNRENRVDAIGYILCEDRIVKEYESNAAE
jgi:hypothetical protein